MNRSWGVVAVLAALLAGALFASSAEANEARIVDQERFSDRVLELTIETPAFAAPTKIHVNLPIGYRADRSRRWPVTYFTAGTMNRYYSFNTVTDGEKISASYPSIIVSPDANSGYWSDWYNGGEFGPPEYETYVIDQLIPLIDARFRTVPNRAHRAIFGISMGGYGAMMLAARHPDLFGAAATLSGAVDSNLPANGAVLSLSSTFDGAPPDAIYGPRASQEVRWRGHNPTDLAANLRTLDLQVRTANGTPNPAIGEDPASADVPSCIVEGGVYMASVDLHRKLKRLGIGHEWKNYGAGCHTVPNFEREVIDTLAALEQTLADPPTRPERFAYRSIEPRFSIWNWTVGADPGRALEFMNLKVAGRSGLTLIGSGETGVRTPRLFRHLRAVDVVAAGGGTSTVRPDRHGRLRFDVDLGAAHPDQQYTPASRAAGDGSDGYFTKRTVAFEPHALLELGRLGARGGRPRVCARTRGGAVGHIRVSLRDGGRRLASSRRFAVAEGRRCVRLRPGAGERLVPGRYELRARGVDRFGHRVAAERHARLR